MKTAVLTSTFEVVVPAVDRSQMRGRRLVRKVSRWRHAAVMSVLAFVAVGACSADEDIVRTEPGLTWVNGAPEGPLDADEWVKAVRDAEFAYAWASNIADFSVPEMTTRWADFSIQDFAAGVRGDLLHKMPHVFLGPWPVAPVAVQVSEDGRTAVVAVCVDAVEQLPHRDDGNRWPNVRFYPMELTDDGDRRVGEGSTPPRPFILPDGAELTPEYCDGVTIPRARFDPPPDLEALSKKGRDDVVLPTPTPTGKP